MLGNILIPASVLLAGIAATIIARAALDDLIRAVRWDRHLRGVPGLDDRLMSHRVGTFRCLVCDDMPFVEDWAAHSALVHQPRAWSPEDSPEWGTR